MTHNDLNFNLLTITCTCSVKVLQPWTLKSLVDKWTKIFS